MLKFMNSRRVNSKALGFVVAMLIANCMLLMCGVFEAAVGRPQLVLCHIAALAAIKPLLDICRRLLPRAEAVDARAAKLAVLRARRSVRVIA